MLAGYVIKLYFILETPVLPRQSDTLHSSKMGWVGGHGSNILSTCLLSTSEYTFSIDNIRIRIFRYHLSSNNRESSILTWRHDAQREKIIRKNILFFIPSIGGWPKSKSYLKQSSLERNLCNNNLTEYIKIHVDLCPFSVVGSRFTYRTFNTIAFVIGFLVFVFLFQGWYIVTYALGIYLLNLFIAFLTPKNRSRFARLWW